MNLITKTTLGLTLGAAVLASLSTLAQNPGRPNRFLPVASTAADPATQTNAQRPARPVPPLIAALDANQDGTLDAAEIANAVAALKTLDANGDGVLTADELHPGRPEGKAGGRGGHGGRGPRGPRPEAPVAE